MNLFGVGPLELAVILIVALVFVGPDRLPRLAADLARTIKEIRKYTSGLAAEFNEVVKDVERETESEKSLWREVSEGVGGATKQVTAAMREVRQDVMKAQGSAAGTNGSAPSQSPAPGGGETTPVPAATNGHTTADTSGWVDIADPNAADSELAAPASSSEATAPTPADERLP